MMDDLSDAMLRDWLLGKLAPADAERLEERLLVEAGFAERLQGAETDLLDDFAQSGLDASDRIAAERLFTTSAKDRQRLRIAQALAARNRPARGIAGCHRRGASGAVAPYRRRTRRLRLAAAAAIAAMCLAVAVVGFLPRAPREIATIALLATTERGVNDIEEVRIARVADALRVQAEVDGDRATARYDLRVLAGDRAVFEARDLAVRTAGAYHYVETTLPTRGLGEDPIEIFVATAGATDPEYRWAVRIRRD